MNYYLSSFSIVQFQEEFGIYYILSIISLLLLIIILTFLYTLM